VSRATGTASPSVRMKAVADGICHLACNAKAGSQDWLRRARRAAPGSPARARRAAFARAEHREYLRYRAQSVVADQLLREAE